MRTRRPHLIRDPTVSSTPQVAPVTLAARVKGRVQHHCRRKGTPIDFSRKLAVRSVGDPNRADVERYIRNQVQNEALADERFREMLTRRRKSRCPF